MLIASIQGEHAAECGWMRARRRPDQTDAFNRQNRTIGISEITPTNRTCCGHAKIDENDPFQTKAASPIWFDRNAERQAPFGGSGLGGVHGDKDSLQIVSLQGQHSLELRPAGYAFCVGKTEH
jgi:hypothetical protein